MTKTFTILKPDKGNGVVVMKRTDYINSVKSLFSKTTKFKQLDFDPTLSRLSSLQNYLRSLLKRCEIYENQFHLLRPRSAEFGRAHGLPKTHKTFDTLPKFRPIIDTTNTPHYNVGKFLSSLLNPLTINEFVLKDSFDAVSAINSIPSTLFSDGHQFVSFDIESLFSNVPLNRTIDIILNRIFNDKLLDTTRSKRTLKKLHIDFCTKTAFSFDNILYEQKDGVSMGAPLSLRNNVVQDLLNSGVLKFYRRYVDDTLVVMKASDIPFVLKKFNSFDKNFNFTIDSFQNSDVHFLHLLITPNVDVFRKTSHTGQYTHFSSFEPWGRKTAWIKSLFHRAVHICSNTSLLNNQISQIISFMSWNGFPAPTRISLINKLKKKHLSPSIIASDHSQSNPVTVIPKIWLRLPYLGNQGELLVRNLLKKNPP